MRPLTLDVYKRQALTDTDMKYLLLYPEETYGLTSEKKLSLIHICEQRKNIFKKMLSVCFVEDLDYQVEERCV